MKTGAIVVRVMVDDWIYCCEITPEQKEKLKERIKQEVFELMLNNLNPLLHPLYSKLRGGL